MDNHAPVPRTSAGSGARYCRVCLRGLTADDLHPTITPGPSNLTADERRALDRLARQISGALNGRTR